MKKKTALIFDFDDTLAQSSHYYINAKNEYISLIQQVVSKNDLHVDLEEFHNKHLKRFTTLDSNRVKTFLLDKNRFLESMIGYYGLILGHYHLLWDCEVEMKIKKIANQVWNTPIIYNETIPVLTDLKNKQYPMYCVTAGCQQMQMRKIEALKNEGWDLFPFFDSITVVEMKDSKTFEKFKNDHKHEKYCVIGDNLQFDCIAPLSVGMNSIWLEKNHSHWNGYVEIPKDNPNIHIVNTLEEAHQVILKNFSF